MQPHAARGAHSSCVLSHTSPHRSHVRPTTFCNIGSSGPSSAIAPAAAQRASRQRLNPRARRRERGARAQAQPAATAARSAGEVARRHVIRARGRHRWRLRCRFHQGSRGILATIHNSARSFRRDAHPCSADTQRKRRGRSDAKRGSMQTLACCSLGSAASRGLNGTRVPKSRSVARARAPDALCIASRRACIG